MENKYQIVTKQKKYIILHDDKFNIYDINCQCKKINIMHNDKELGVEISSNMKWNVQINSKHKMVEK